MSTPAQSITVYEGERVPLTLTTTDTFNELTVKLQIGVVSSPSNVKMIKEVTFDTDGDEAQAVLVVDIPSGKYVSQLLMTDDGDVMDITPGPAVNVLPSMQEWEP